MNATSPEQPPITVVIVAWNQLDITLECLAQVAQLDYANCCVLLVDNGSDPPLAPAVAERFPAVQQLRLPTNLGFAGGYNAGVREALAGGAHHVLLLNNDAFPTADVLSHLLAELESSPDVGLVTAKIYYRAEPQRIWTVGAKLNVFLDLRDSGDRQIDVGQWDTPRDVDFAPFCAILVRYEVFETVGWLDEAYFLYYEDMDYCRRARAAGWRIRLAPAAHVYHAVSTSSGGGETPTKRYWLGRSSGRYFRRHGHGPRMLLIIPFRLGSAIKITLRLLRRGQFATVRAHWAGLLRGWLGDA